MTCLEKYGRENVGVQHLVCHRHLLYDLLDVLISSLYNAIHLRPVRRRVIMLDLELCAELGDHSVIKIATIIRDDSF